MEKSDVSLLGKHPHSYRHSGPRRTYANGFDDALSLAWAWALNEQQTYYFWNSYHGKWYVNRNPPEYSVCRGEYFEVDKQNNCKRVEL